MRTSKLPQAGPLWLSRAQVARLLQVAPITVARWAAAGKLPYSVTLGGRRRYPREDILVILKRLTEPRSPNGRRRHVVSARRAAASPRRLVRRKRV